METFAKTKGTMTSWAASTILVHLRVRLVPRFCGFPVHLQLPLSACSIPSRRVLMAAPNNAPTVLDKEQIFRMVNKEMEYRVELSNNTSEHPPFTSSIIDG